MFWPSSQTSNRLFVVICLHGNIPSRLVNVWLQAAGCLGSPWTCCRIPVTPSGVWTDGWGAFWSRWTDCRGQTGGWRHKLQTGASEVYHTLRTGPSRNRLSASSERRSVCLTPFILYVCLLSILHLKMIVCNCNCIRSGIPGAMVIFSSRLYDHTHVTLAQSQIGRRTTRAGVCRPTIKKKKQQSQHRHSWLAEPMTDLLNIKRTLLKPGTVPRQRWR